MPISPGQLAAGRAVKRQLERAEAAHPDSLSLRRLHKSLAVLRDAFRIDMTDDDFVTFGGGTPKTDEPEGGG